MKIKLLCEYVSSVTVRTASFGAEREALAIGPVLEDALRCVPGSECQTAFWLFAIWGLVVTMPLWVGAFWYKPERRRRRESWWERQWRQVRRGGRTWMRSTRAFLRRWTRNTGRFFREENHRSNQNVQAIREEGALVLSSILHDLKSPLLEIRTRSSALLETEALSGSMRDEVEVIRDAAGASMDHLDRLIAFAASSASESERAPVALDLLVERSIEGIQSYAERNDQRVQYRSAAEPCVVMGIELKLREAVVTVIYNALKDAPRGETVDVDLNRVGGRVRFSVSGAGPDPEDRRASLGSLPTEEERPGLGRHAVSPIVDLHGGEMEVDRSEGDRTTVSLFFRAANVSSADVSERESVPAS